MRPSPTSASLPGGKGYLVLQVVAKLIIPYILLFALYVQFHGDFGPGGGFQAGVIFSAGVILYSLAFDLPKAMELFSPRVLRPLAAAGVLLYGGVGSAGMLLGGQFLDYKVLAYTPQAGQHIGIVLIEFGVGLTVTCVMLLIFFAFAQRSEEPP